MNRRPNIVLTRVLTIDNNDPQFCSVCQRGKLYDDTAENPLRVWVYPCNCTLVAHKSCLPDWNDCNALRCLQCGIKYELANNQSLTLHCWRLGNRIFQRASRIIRVVGIAGIYVIATMYGTWAVKQFIGPEMHALILPKDPTVWHWSTFIDLPHIPFALILDSSSLLPRTISFFLPIFMRISLPWFRIPWRWPPAPISLDYILVPLFRYAYRKAWNRLQVHVLGSVPLSVYNVGDTVLWDALPIRTQTEIDNGRGAQQRQRHVQNQTIMAIQSSLDRRIGGALLTPWISNRMGALLLAVSKYSTIVARILAVRPQAQVSLGQLQRKSGATLWQLARTDPSVWAETDPIWWRNTLGLGLFVVVKDTVELLHHWLAMRELRRSLHVKSRDVADVDVREPDSRIPGFRPDLASTVQSVHAQLPLETTTHRVTRESSQHAAGHETLHPHYLSTDAHPHQADMVLTPELNTDNMDPGDLQQDLTITRHTVVRESPAQAVDHNSRHPHQLTALADKHLHQADMIPTPGLSPMLRSRSREIFNDSHLQQDLVQSFPPPNPNLQRRHHRQWTLYTPNEGSRFRVVQFDTI